MSKKSQNWNPNLWPPFTQISLGNPPQRILTAKDALLLRDGESPLIDAISSWWVTLHGHSNPYIANAIATQARELEQVIFADFIHPQAERLAERLVKVTGLDRLFFSDNGSTAVEVALKIACQWWKNIEEPRYQLIAFDGAYHGDTFGAMSLGERNLFNEPFKEMLFPVSRLPWPSTWWGDETVEHKEKSVLNALDNLLETPTAAVILEPLVQGAGGMSIVRETFLKEVEVRVKQANSLLIADEVLTGFGRCGTLFASHRAGLKPDLFALSKGLTGGFLPMGVTMSSEKIFSSFIGEDPKVTFWHGHSFTGNPLGCAAANASLDLLEDQPENYTNFQLRHQPYLQDLAKHKKIEKPRLIGTISAFNLKNNGESGYLNSAGRHLKSLAIEHGVFLRPLGDVIYLMPPLCITDAQLEYCYSVIKNCLDEI